MTVLNVGHFAGSGVVHVPKRLTGFCGRGVPKLPTLCAGFFDFETETGKNADECPSQNKPYNPER